MEHNSPKMSGSCRFTGINLPLWELLSLGIIALGVLLKFLLLDAGDATLDDNTAMYLDCGRLILACKVPYFDFFDLNPPFVMYLSIIPASLAAFSHLDVRVICSGLVLLLIAFSFCFSFWLLNTSSLRRYRLPFLAGLALFNILLGTSFAERDHLFLLLVIPFLLLRLRRYDLSRNGERPDALGAEEARPDEAPSRKVEALSSEGTASELAGPAAGLATGLIAGLAAGLAISIKPQCIILPLLVESGLFLGRRFDAVGQPGQLSLARVPEGPALLVVPVLYGLCLLALPAASSAYLFGELLPLLIKAYNAYNIPIGECLDLISVPPTVLPGILGFALVVCGGCLAIRLRWCARLFYSLLVAWCVAGYLIYVIQSKGWAYQTLTAQCGFLLLVSVLTFELLGYGYGKFRLVQSFACRLIVILILACGLFPVFPWSVCRPFYSFTTDRHSVIINSSSRSFRANKGPGALALSEVYNGDYSDLIDECRRVDEPILFLSTDTSPAYPALLGQRPASRYLWCYPLVLYQYMLGKATAGNAASIERKLAEIVASIAVDVENYRPRIIAMQVKTRPQSCFSIKPLFDKSEKFKRVLKSYRQYEQQGAFCIFRRR